LLPSKKLKGKLLTDFIQIRDSAKNQTERARLNLVLAYAYQAQERWTELVAVAEELTNGFPDSFVAFEFATKGYAGLMQFAEWENLVQSRLQKHSEEPQYIRASATLARYRNDFTRSRQLIKGLMDRSKASEQDLNSYAWDILSLGKPDQEAIEAAQRADQLTKNANFSIVHTLACLYAEAGKTTQARELLLKAMEVSHLQEPDPAIWFGMAEIA
jgi:histone deacetylase complex regulatory component SIN3